MSLSRLVQLVVFLLVLGSSDRIHAQEGEPEPAVAPVPAAPEATPAPAPPASGAPAPVTKEDLFPTKAPTPRKWVVSISPLHLALPVIEITGERRINANLGVTLMMGAGSVTDQADPDLPGDVDNTFKLFEMGTSVRYYGLGSFARGMQFGGAVEYIRLTGDNIDGSMISGIGSGVVIAPFVGYKHTWRSGITFDGQLGLSYAAIRAEAEDGSVQEESNRVTAYINLNVGWSF